jgi:hypothetical protein
LNQTLPPNRRIRFAGIDRIQERRLTGEYLTELLRGRKLTAESRVLADTLTARLLTRRPDSLRAEAAQQLLNNLTTHRKAYSKVMESDLPALEHLLTNIVYLKTLKSREATIFANFKAYWQTLHWQTEKLYGFWGYFHVLQAPVEGGAKSFATMLRESDLPLRDKVVSLTFAFVDSYMMLPSVYLPPMWQTPGKTFSRVNQFNNNSPLMFTEGIDQLIAQTKPHSLTLFRLSGTEAGQRPTRVRYGSFMPKEQQLQFEANCPTTDYFQYLILVRNSDMTEPLQP